MCLNCIYKISKKKKVEFELLKIVEYAFALKDGFWVDTFRPHQKLGINRANEIKKNKWADEKILYSGR